MQKKVLILSGPTHEYIDPVRFIGNASSGLMGKAIAEEAVRRNYAVEFITGPVAPANLPLPVSCTLHHVVSAKSMLARAGELFAAADIIIFAAAVADYTPSVQLTEKIAKSNEPLLLELSPTPDIAKTLCAAKTSNQIAIGFALQTADGERNARRKLESKKLDHIVLNTPDTLGASTGYFSFLSAGADRFEKWGLIDKAECAQRIFDRI
jgi:phosphopantothenoylcysteine decarboxylase/phosphopantothenate--cysteine ligase